MRVVLGQDMIVIKKEMILGLLGGGWICCVEAWACSHRTVGLSRENDQAPNFVILGWLDCGCRDKRSGMCKSG